MPVFTISIWKPYESYCLSRLDTYFAVPPWCYDFMPVLNHFQFSAPRTWYSFAWVLFTNQLLIYIVYRLILGHKLDFFSMGIFNTINVESIERKSDVFTCLALLPLAYVCVINMVLSIYVEPNAEINDGVANV